MSIGEILTAKERSVGAVRASASASATVNIDTTDVARTGRILGTLESFSTNPVDVRYSWPRATPSTSYQRRWVSHALW